MKILRSRSAIAGLHVIQCAAAPAGEPRPIAVDVVSRSIVEAGVKHLATATACFAGIVTFFSAGTAFFIRFLAYFFVSHTKSILSCYCLVLLTATSFDPAANLD